MIKDVLLSTIALEQGGRVGPAGKKPNNRDVSGVRKSVIIGPEKTPSNRTYFIDFNMVSRFIGLLLMEEILHHLGYINLLNNSRRKFS